MFRQVRRMTQYDLAIAVDVSPTHISEIETGKRIPSEETLQRIIFTLGLSVQERARLGKSVARE